ncbi:MAG: hypothetical protein K2I32_06975 [Alistipes sp.]|nr:hypothetical protein [Alistipes sp.]
MDFEDWLDDALRANGFLFPESDEQMKHFEQTAEIQQRPSHLQTTDFVYEH